MATSNFYVLPRPLQSDRDPKEEHRVEAGQPSFSRPEAETEPETRLWKVCAEAACPRHSGFEWVAFLVLGILALGVLAYSFSGLSLLVSTDDFDRTVRVLLGTS